MTIALVALYLISAVTANLAVAYFGQPALLVTALVFIPIDMTARDLLNLKWQDKGLRPMAALIASGSILTAAANWGAANVALASATAFAASGIVDWEIFEKLRGKTKFVRMNVSNFVSAIVDSTLFPLIAFGLMSVSLSLCLSQAALKIIGGLCFSYAFLKVKQ